MWQITLNAYAFQGAGGVGIDTVLEGFGQLANVYYRIAVEESQPSLWVFELVLQRCCFVGYSAALSEDDDFCLIPVIRLPWRPRCLIGVRRAGKPLAHNQY